MSGRTTLECSKALTLTNPKSRRDDLHLSLNKGLNDIEQGRIIDGDEVFEQLELIIAEKSGVSTKTHSEIIC